MTEYVLGFEQINRTMVAVAGGKGANLGELSRLRGISVPEGFCVTTDAYAEALACSVEVIPLLEKLSHINTSDTEGIRTVEAEVRTQLGEDSPVPVRFVTRLGRPTDCLSAIADEVRADVVVVGASRGWRRWCGVPVAAGLIRIGRWPVVVVP